MTTTQCAIAYTYAGMRWLVRLLLGRYCFVVRRSLTKRGHWWLNYPLQSILITNSLNLSNATKLG